MPSIPQSLLWISLVVLWLFVLVPMLINKRDTVRRTSDVALATRVLNGGVRSRLIRRSGPAAGHRHDPDWQDGGHFVEDYPDYDETFAEAGDFADQREMIQEYDDAVREARMTTRSVVVVAAVSERSLVDPDYLDVDIVDETSGALPVGVAGEQATLFETPQVATDTATAEPTADAVEEAPEEVSADQGDAEPVDTVGGGAPDGTADDYEYIDDTSDLELEEHLGARTAAHSSSRQRRLSNSTAAAVSARKYRFRKRALLVMAALLVLSATLSFTVSPALWWSCGAVGTVAVLYLAYLRRQTRIEEQVRRRRSQRMARSRPVYEERRDTGVDFTEFPTRLQRPGAVVLDIDDEDPIFEHLDEVPYSPRYYGSRDLPRAAGQ